MIVFEDADLARATAGALWGGMTNSGQSCTSVELLYIREEIYPAFRERLLARARKLIAGRDLGRITTGFQVEKIRAQLEDAKRRGARILCGEQWDGRSDVVPPIIVEDVPEDALMLHEETFGPVIPLLRFKDEAEVVRRINLSPYGLSASVWTADTARAERVARALETGNVSINNVMLTEGNPALPFGGVKQSGFGREKGAQGLLEFTRSKSVLFDKNGKKIEAHWFPYVPEKLGLFARLSEALFGGGLLRLLRFALAGLKLESLSGRLEKEGKGG
jgi:acyl-CoA reductase-like NAD-dependent aldehyde dehydrogenase